MNLLEISKRLHLIFMALLLPTCTGSLLEMPSLEYPFPPQDVGVLIKKQPTELPDVTYSKEFDKIVGTKGKRKIVIDDTIIDIHGKSRESGKSQTILSNENYNSWLEIVQKSLLKSGFDLIDKSKLEAKLRELTTKSHKMDEAQGKSEIQEKELEKRTVYDTSELVRAASIINAELVLQINNLDIAERSFVVPFNNEVLSMTFGSQQMELHEYNLSFNVRLIDVETGSVIWMGEHKVASRSLMQDDAKINFHCEMYAANKESVQKAVDYGNFRIKRANLKKKVRQIVEKYVVPYEYKWKIKPDPNSIGAFLTMYRLLGWFPRDLLLHENQLSESEKTTHRQHIIALAKKVTFDLIDQISKKF